MKLTVGVAQMALLSKMLGDPRVPSGILLVKIPSTNNHQTARVSEPSGLACPYD